jgi:hypothetical protein
MDVDFRARTPALTPNCGVRGHGRAVRGDPLPMKSGLREPSLAEMMLVLAREESSAEEGFRALEAAALVEVLVVRNEDVADQVRMAEQVQRFGA